MAAFSWSSDPDATYLWARNLIERRVRVLDDSCVHAANREHGNLNETLALLRSEVKERGLWGPSMTRAEGGSELSSEQCTQLDRAIGLSRWAPYVFGHQPHQQMYARVIDRFGSSECRQRYASAILAGECIVAYALNEPYVGGTKHLLRTTARRVDNTWVLSGEKWFVDDANYADVMIVVARTRDASDQRRNFSLFCVPRDQVGVSTSKIPVSGPEPWETDYGHVRFTDVHLPDTHLLHEEGGAYEALASSREHVDLHLQARAVEILERCVDAMKLHCVSHEAKLGALSDFATTKTVVAKAFWKVQQFEAMLFKAAKLFDEQGQDAALPYIMGVKASLPELLTEVVHDTRQMHGVLGLSANMPFGAWEWTAASLAIAEGPVDVMWADLGRSLLGAVVPRERYAWPEEWRQTTGGEATDQALGRASGVPRYGAEGES